MTDDRTREPEEEPDALESSLGHDPEIDPDEHVPVELEHSSAGADEAREVVAGHEGAHVDEFELEQQALHAEGDLTGDGEIDEDDRAVAASRGRRVGAGRSGGGPRFIQFLRASWAELRRVQWPDRRQVAQATAVVIGFVIVIGAFLGFADWAAQKLVDIIL